MTSLVLRNARVLVPGGLTDGTLVIEEGRIAGVNDDGAAGEGLDLRGATVLPGFIDLHNDGLEVEINPRPGVGLPLEFALQNFDLRAASAGLAMVFHAITFADFVKKARTVEVAAERVRAIRALDNGRTVVEHKVLFRADLWQPDGLPLLLECAEEWDERLVTINDHTPGQGQYRDVDGYKKFVREWAGTTEEELDRSTSEKMAFAADNPEVAASTLRILSEARDRLGLVLGSHDDDSPERCSMMHRAGATIAEFPVTVEAAGRARELGMTIVAGAPNVVRGGSHSGNVAALELLQHGLCDVLVADYHAPSLVLAVQRIVESGLLTLEEGVNLVSRNPARAIGREDLGTIEPGRAATLTILRMEPGRPWQAVGVVRDGVFRAAFEDLQQVRREPLGV